MSVIVKTKQQKIKIFCKGSPETIKLLCKSETISKDYDQILSQYTAQGFRVLGCAYKEIDLGNESDIQFLTRKEAEKELKFIGFFILENKLKNATQKVLFNLSEAKIRSIMVTGDNIRTALR